MENTTPSAPVPNPPPAVSGEDKTVAIICYLTLIGFIVAIILHSSKKTKLGAYHLRQSLGLFLTAIALWIAAFVVIFAIALVLHFLLILLPLLNLTINVALLTLWVMGLIAAVNGEMKPMPIVGPLYQKWFGTAFE